MSSFTVRSSIRLRGSGRVSDRRASQGIEGAADGAAALVQDVGVDHRGLDALVTEQLLDGADVVAVLEQMGGEGMAQAVAAGGLVDAGGSAGAADGPLDGAGAQVEAVDLTGQAMPARLRTERTTARRTITPPGYTPKYRASG